MFGVLASQPEYDGVTRQWMLGGPILRNKKIEPALELGDNHESRFFNFYALLWESGSYFTEIAQIMQLASNDAEGFSKLVWAFSVVWADHPGLKPPG